MLDSLIDQFNSNIPLILEKYAPLKTVTVKPSSSNSWFTSNLLSERSRDVKNVIKQIKNVKKNKKFRKNKKRYKKRIINCWVPVVRNYRNQHLLGAKQLQWPAYLPEEGVL